MTLLEFKRYFTQELTSIYSESESAELYSIFAYKIIGFNKFQQREFMNQHLLKKHVEDFELIITELKTGKPFQQILGETEFYGMKFFLDENVLIPRPETEELLELAINKIQDKSKKKQVIQSSEKSLSFGNRRLADSVKIIDGDEAKGFRERIKILDIGTGSGIIPIVLKKHFPEAEISAIDVSNDALKIAKKNADFHQLKINFIHQDFLNEKLNDVYDIIISNPPYIGIDEENEIADSVKDFEPKIALFSPTQNPLIFYEKIAQDCKNFLLKDGLLLLEINQKLGKETLDLFRDILSETLLIKDLSGNNRFIFGKK